MNNLQRLQMETKGIELQQDELIIYLEENNLSPFVEYKVDSATSRKYIYQAALSVLETVANDITRFANKQHEDFNVSDFSVSIQNRIDQLERKIRKLKTDEDIANETNFFMLFAD